MNILLIAVMTVMISFPVPLPKNFHEHEGVMKGAVLGFSKRPVSFSSKKGMKELSYLYDERNVRMIVSLDHCKDTARLVKKFLKKRPKAQISHICRKIRRGKRSHKSNVALFEEIGMLIRTGKTFYIHCRYGAHRAVTALTGGWINANRTSFRKGFRLSGGNMSHFRSKGQRDLLNHARKYSRKFKHSK